MSAWLACYDQVCSNPRGWASLSCWCCQAPAACGSGLEHTGHTAVMAVMAGGMQPFANASSSIVIMQQSGTGFAYADQQFMNQRLSLHCQ